MKNILDWHDKKIVSVLDEVSLWSAPFGKLLLENIPMKQQAKVLDLGFGTGFPLIELSQRFGSNSIIYGVDIWQEAIDRCSEKIDVLGLTNIKILNESAEHIQLKDKSIDLITSNLGINNFDNQAKVLSECYRVLKNEGSLCITTNPIGTFKELYTVFLMASTQLGTISGIEKIEKNINHRGTPNSIVKDFKKVGFNLTRKKESTNQIRFVDAIAVFDYFLIRIGFRASWNEFIESKEKNEFYETCISEINKCIKLNGEFTLSIPILYLEFEKVNLP